MNRSRTCWNDYANVKTCHCVDMHTYTQRILDLPDIYLITWCVVCGTLLRKVKIGIKE